MGGHLEVEAENQVVTSVTTQLPRLRDIRVDSVSSVQVEQQKRRKGGFRTCEAEAAECGATRNVRLVVTASEGLK